MIASVIAFHLFVAVLVDDHEVRIFDAGAKGSRAECETARSAPIAELAQTSGRLDAHAVVVATACKVAGTKT